MRPMVEKRALATARSAWSAMLLTGDAYDIASRSCENRARAGQKRRRAEIAVRFSLLLL